MFLNHFCLRKAHTKMPHRNGDVPDDRYKRLHSRRSKKSDFRLFTAQIWSPRGCRLQRVWNFWVLQPEIWRSVRRISTCSCCVNAASEGDLNMHSSKGFYTTILVSDESHSLTALYSQWWSLSILCMGSVYIQERNRLQFRPQRSQWAKSQIHSRVSLR